jgi:small-conductance mechanosensitive channel
MTYNIKSKKPKEKYYLVEKKNQQTEINNLLFKKTNNKNPKLLTIIVRSDKEHFFHFLKNETEFEVQGKWHSKKGKAFEENNEEITIQYFDDDKGSITKQLKNKFKEYNKRYVKEEVLYTTTTPLEMTSLA